MMVKATVDSCEMPIMLGIVSEFLYTLFIQLNNLQMYYIAMSTHSFNKLKWQLFIKPAFIKQLLGARYSGKHRIEIKKWDISSNYLTATGMQETKALEG